MKKVVHINLNGKAYQVEEAGYEKLKTYLGTAEKKLAHNPDKDEIVRDIEQAIADKCEAKLRPGKNVITEDAVEEIIAKIGPVEAVSDDEETAPPAENDPRRTRKLYSLPKEGTISGVCAGLAAYFGTDVTVMRLIFVILLFVTHGAMAIMYFVLALIMPEARTPEEIADAHGRAMTAQGIISQMHMTEPAQDAVTRAGKAITVVGRFIIKLLAILIVAFGVVWTAIAGWVLWLILLGKTVMTDQLAVLNGWRQAVFVTAIYLLLAIPLYWLYQVIRAAYVTSDDRPRQLLSGGTAGLAALWIGSMVALVTMVSVYAHNAQAYIDTHNGYIQVGGSRLCVDEIRCDGKTHRYFDGRMRYNDWTREQ